METFHDQGQQSTVRTLRHTAHINAALPTHHRNLLELLTLPMPTPALLQGLLHSPVMLEERETCLGLICFMLERVTLSLNCWGRFVFSPQPEKEGNKQLRSSSILNSCSCFPSERDSEPQCSRAKAQNIATILAKYFASCLFFFFFSPTQLFNLLVPMPSSSQK